ncbi:MAG: SsrA-binding protein SmpB [Planctomycetota bacterium]|nr:SsrA-binding protein SmpB [Planctomycetota bacterium]
MSEKPQEVRGIAANKRARFEYQILEEIECGIALTGTEVKVLRSGRCSLQEAWGQVRSAGAKKNRAELYLVGANIPEYAQGNVHNHKPDRDRKLLAKRREIDSLHASVKQKGVTLVPLAIYFKGSRVKVQLGLAKGKKLYDKRADKKEKDDKREIDRAMSKSRRG